MDSREAAEYGMFAFAFIVWCEVDSESVALRVKIVRNASMTHLMVFAAILNEANSEM